MDNISTSYNLEVSYTYVESNIKIMALIEELVTKMSCIIKKDNIYYIYMFFIYMYDIKIFSP